MRHAAKIDPLIGLGILAGIVVPSVSAVERSESWELSVSIFIALMILGFCYPQWDETTAEALVIRAGVSTYRIPYPEITSVHRSTCRRISFALSLDRVEIRYGTKLMLIAPKDQEAFLRDVASRAPQLSTQGPAVGFSPFD